MTFDEALDHALGSAQPLQALSSMAQQRLELGQTIEELTALFEQARRRLRATGRDADEDTLLEAMDFLAGWCSPHMKLHPEPGSTQRADAPTTSRSHRELAPARQGAAIRSKDSP